MQHKLQTYPPSAFNRLSALAGLTERDRARLQNAANGRTLVPRHRDLIKQGEPITSARLMLEGWAYRAQIVPNGHRQIIDFVLPGELLGMCVRRNPVAVSTTTTLTPVVTCAVPMPDPEDHLSGLAQAYAVSASLEEAYLCRQIIRIGRMSAFERMVDWLLELHDRLLLAGLASPDDFAIPLTQEVIADALGLTSVHVNRTVRALREAGLVTVGAKRVVIHDRDKMQRLVCYESATAVC